MDLARQLRRATTTNHPVDSTLILEGTRQSDNVGLLNKGSVGRVLGERRRPDNANLLSRIVALGRVGSETILVVEEVDWAGDLALSQSRRRRLHNRPILVGLAWVGGLEARRRLSLADLAAIPLRPLSQRLDLASVVWAVRNRAHEHSLNVHRLTIMKTRSGHPVGLRTHTNNLSSGRIHSPNEVDVMLGNSSTSLQRLLRTGGLDSVVLSTLSPSQLQRRPVSNQSQSQSQS